MVLLKHVGIPKACFVLLVQACSLVSLPPLASRCHSCSQHRRSSCSRVSSGRARVVDIQQRLVFGISSDVLCVLFLSVLCLFQACDLQGSFCMRCLIRHEQLSFDRDTWHDVVSTLFFYKIATALATLSCLVRHRVRVSLILLRQPHSSTGDKITPLSDPCGVTLCVFACVLWRRCRQACSGMSLAEHMFHSGCVVCSCAVYSLRLLA